MGWTLLSANSVCEITTSSKNNLERRDNEKKNFEKNEMSNLQMRRKASLSSASIPETEVNYGFT